MTWEEYEEVTKYVYETLGKEKGVTIECFGKDCKVQGKSEVKHQIDVLTNFSDGLHNYKTAIECKYWNKNIDKDIVMKVAEIIEDAAINKGVIVSKKGFTPDAISYAKYKNIGLVELREFEEGDWKGRIKSIKFNINMLLPQINSLEFFIDKETVTDLEPGEMLVENLRHKNRDGEIIGVKFYIEDFSSELTRQKEDENFEKIYKFEGENFIINGITNSETLIGGLKLTGVLKIAKEGFQINGEDHVWLIMKAYFEDKTYTISKDKEIRER